jgi:hypothetical protein
MLEDEGVLEHIKMGEYHLGLLPFDSDLLTLEMGVAFKHVRKLVSTFVSSYENIRCSKCTTLATRTA